MVTIDEPAAARATDPFVDFRTEPPSYHHWKLDVEPPVATLTLDVDERAGLFPGCELKLNSYDLSVDIELADAVTRLRFEHPDVRVVVIRSGKDRVFCAGANIRMLASASHGHKVNFCKFTNETRLAIEDAAEHSDQHYVTVIAGTAAGGGYELALATEHIILADDGSSTVSLPEVPLLAVLPGTGGLTRLVDKRHVRRDLADVFCTTEEGVKGRRALEWGLVDELATRSNLDAAVTARVGELAGRTNPKPATGITLTPLERELTEQQLQYRHVSLVFSRDGRTALITINGPTSVPSSVEALQAQGAQAWAVRAARELDDAILYLRFNEPQLGVVVFKTSGDPHTALAYEAFLDSNRSQWLVSEVRNLWKRVLKRIDLTSRSFVALVEPSSCFAGTLAELVLAADRSYALAGDEPCGLVLAPGNFGAYPMSNGLSRLESRFLGNADRLEAARAACGRDVNAHEASELGVVTFALDDIDYEDEVRLFLEERAAFSPDALTAMEANLRFGGPETMETKIFARLTAWQNWVFQRPNAAGPEGALRRYGTGQKATFDPHRV